MNCNAILGHNACYKVVKVSYNYKKLDNMQNKVQQKYFIKMPPHKFKTQTSLIVLFQLFEELVDSKMESLGDIHLSRINE